MSDAKSGDTVTVHYIGTLDNGRIFDQRDADNPLTFTLGAGEVFAALEGALIDMRAGEVKNVHLRAEQAFGPWRDENLLRVARELFPTGQQLSPGRKLSVELAGGDRRVMRIREVGEQDVLLDGNHELAGCDLTFALQLVAIE